MNFFEHLLGMGDAQKAHAQYNDPQFQHHKGSLTHESISSIQLPTSPSLFCSILWIPSQCLLLHVALRL